MRHVDARELDAMHRESPVLMKESSVSIRWYRRPKTLLKKLYSLSIDVVILPCPPIHCQTLFFQMPFNPVEIDRERKLLDDISDYLNIVK